jgi:hypothetical protein
MLRCTLLGLPFAVDRDGLPVGWAEALGALDDPSDPVLTYAVRGEALLVDGTRLGTGPPDHLLALLLADVRVRAVAQPGTVALHAALVASGTHLVLLPGPSGTGKTTLALQLAAAGWGYLGDEVVGVEPVSGRLLPAVTPPRVLGPSGKRHQPFPRGHAPDRPTRTYVVLQRRSSGCTSVQRLEPVAALAQLAESVFAGPPAEMALDAVLRVLARSETYVLESASIASALQAVLSLVEPQRPAGSTEPPGCGDQQGAERRGTDQVAQPVRPQP